MMTTNSRLATLTLVANFIFMMACGGGGGGGVSGGIGGSGFTAVSVGSVSATGSITVNGVRYQTTGAAVNRDDGASFSEADLKIGLVVEVNGQVNADGVNGTATTVTVLTAVQGPVDQIALATNNLTVMGQPVAIDDQTLFDDSIPNNNLTGLIPGNIVEVSGTMDPNGTIRAMRIEAKPGETLKKVRGFVNTVAAPTFTINGLTIDFSTAVENDFGANGPPVGAFVAVRGTSLVLGDTLIADVVDDETRSFANETNAEIEGFITVAAGNIFTLVSGAGTFQFQTDAGTIFEGGVAADLVVGLKVEVEGAFSGGVMIADKVSIQDGIRLREVTVDTVNLAERTLTLVDLSALVLKLNDQTDISDDRSAPPAGQNPTPDQLLPTLSPNDDELRVRARISNTVLPGATELVVTELRVRDGPPSPAARLRGPLDTLPGPNGPLQILGITVTFDGATTFSDLNGLIDQATFISQVDTGSLIQAEGPLSSDNTMEATQLEIED